MTKINTIARPRTIIEWGPLSPNACASALAGHYASTGIGTSAGTTRLSVPAMAGTAANAEAAKRGMDLRVAVTTQESPPRGNPR